MSKTNPARRMRDFLPADVRRRNYVIGVIKKVYESFGFEPLETPAVENLETLMGKYGDEGSQLIFKILKRGEKLKEDLSTGELADLALRYDLTVPLARVVANRRSELPKFFKRYQIQPVWRADRPARGRFREFYQCDVDAIGSTSMMVEAELITAVSASVKRLGFADFTVRINHREVLRGMLTAVGIPETQHTDALVALDKLDKIGTDGVLREFEMRSIAGASADIELFDSHKDKSDRDAITVLREFIGGNGDGLDELEQILDLTDAPIKIDASLARGLSYYTGVIMEINVPDLAGSLGGGGRYDGLIGMFGKEQIPACGFSLGLERIIVVMDERGMFPPDAAAADVMVTNMDSPSHTLLLANELRQSGLRVVTYPDADKFGKQMSYANALGVPFVCIVGENEIAADTVTIKDMQTGEQTSVPRGDCAKFLTERRNAK